ncbi:5076_t:CDS:2 [Acaulospora morrowiae]|uniref:5076_t:CDS:1 n=1 Tax=Acaulospora morrowiae TaxID=94023 RepID=A0A9N9ADF5_9GLOM|nr:5076_t:CDS:2 [Acaulospora morrowiae]
MEKEKKLKKQMETTIWTCLGIIILKNVVVYETENDSSCRDKSSDDEDCQNYKNHDITVNNLNDIKSRYQECLSKINELYLTLAESQSKELKNYTPSTPEFLGKANDVSRSINFELSPYITVIIEALWDSHENDDDDDYLAEAEEDPENKKDSDNTEACRNQELYNDDDTTITTRTMIEKRKKVSAAKPTNLSFTKPHQDLQKEDFDEPTILADHLFTKKEKRDMVSIYFDIVKNLTSIYALILPHRD